ncbi:MAG: hypothetical protein ACWA40_04810 [Planktomarina sp.]
MAELTFDKLTFVDRLKSGGFTDEQARAQAEALDGALRDTVATRSDIQRLESLVSTVELRIVKWLIPLLLGQAALVITLVKLL